MNLLYGGVGVGKKRKASSPQQPTKKQKTETGGEWFVYVYFHFSALLFLPNIINKLLSRDQHEGLRSVFAVSAFLGYILHL